MAKMTVSGLKTLADTYVAAAAQAGTWSASTENIYGAIDKIGKMVMLDGKFIDKLPELDGEDLPLGKTIEEYFIDLTLPEPYTNPVAEGAKDVVPAFPTVEACTYSYSLGREKIKVTAPYDVVERASRSVEDASNMITKILERLGNSYEMFKFATKKQLLGRAADKAFGVGLYEPISVPVDTDTGKKFIKQIKDDVETASFAHEGGLNHCLIGAAPELVLYVKKGVMPSIEVDTLAGAFNKENLAIPARVKVVDDFGKMAHDDIYAILVDPRGIKLHRDYHAIRQSENADGDFINYVDHSEHTGFISKNVFIKVYKTLPVTK